MIFSLLERIDRYRRRLGITRAAKMLGEFSVGDRSLFNATIVAAAGKNMNLKTCSIIVGDGSLINGCVHFERDYASLRIGSNSFIGMSDLIISTSIVVGSNVLIAHGVMIQDHNSHSLSAEIRQNDLKALLKGQPKDWSSVDCEPITIEDDAWISARAIVLKGVRVGHDSVVAAGLVVTKDVPPHTIVGGNPAREIGKTSR